MDKMTSRGKWAVVGILAVLLIAVLVIAMHDSNQPTTATNSSSTDASGSGTAVGTVTGTTSGGNGVANSKPSAPIIIKLITPVTNDVWRIGEQNSIVWTREASVTGEIDILDAKTKALVGVILSETGPHQTSYAWDTRNIFLNRYSPLKKDILPGTYYIRLKFDGNNLSPLTSPMFTITN